MYVENGIMINANVNVENQWNIAHAKKIMPEILAYVLVSVKRIVILANIWKISHVEKILLII